MLTLANIQAAIAARLRPRLKKFGLSLDNTLEECRRLAYARPGPMFEDANGKLLPFYEWPKEDRQTVLQLLALKQQALTGVLRIWKHAGMYGQPAQETNITVNNVMIVPIERLTDEELEFYGALGEKRRATPIEPLDRQNVRPGGKGGASAIASGPGPPVTRPRPPGRFSSRSSGSPWQTCSAACDMRVYGQPEPTAHQPSGD